MSLTTSAHWMYNPATGFYGTEIDNSLRFNDNDSAYLVRTPASNGTRTTWTLSFWVKRCELGSNNYIFSSGSSTSNYFLLGFNSDDRLVCEEVASGVNTWLKRSSNRYRDVSSWYHVVIVLDTNNGTASDRIRMYVNNERITSFVTNINPGSGTGSQWNNTTAHDIGRSGSTGLGYYDGYLSEINFIDGSALDPTSFGETKSGVWIPKAYSGSYGTNGFHLEFAGNANDTSGNGNNFTSYNISSYDYLSDSPTNNFCTQNSLSNLNWLSQGASFTTEEGNLGFDVGTGGNMQDATFAMPSGKWYWEVRHFNYAMIGIHSIRAIPTGDLTYRYYVPTGQIRYIPYNSTSSTLLTTVSSSTSGDIIGVAFDADNKTISWYKNGSLLNTQTGLVDDVYVPCVGAAAVSSNGRINFGQDSTFAGATTAGGNTDDNGYGDFKYSPPSGYLALCSANLPDPAIDPAQDESPADYFNTVAWTGTGSGQSITGMGFQPDLLWFKQKNGGADHGVMDSVRGRAKGLRTNSTSAENTSGTSNDLVSFDSDGFTTGTPQYFGSLGSSGYTIETWGWKAGGAAVSNTDGSVTSSVSANTDAGFSIQTWTGTGSNLTVGHGLGVAPAVYIVKRRDSTSSWHMYHQALGPTKGIQLSANGDQITLSTYWNNTAPTSSVFTLGTYSNVNTNGGTYVGYAFAEKEGFSKFGSYIGNGSTDGAFVYTGFRPAWVMFKRYDSTSNWNIFDNKMNSYNLAGSLLEANTADAQETNSTGVDFLSNGIKTRNTFGGVNASGANILYLAFAENPFKYANAR